MKTYEVTVNSGEDIKTVITDYILNQHWSSVYITGAIGSAIAMSFTTPIKNTLPLTTVVNYFADAAEIVSFTGEVMLKEKMDSALKAVYQDQSNPLFVHIHASCAYKEGVVHGGGLASGKAFRAIRIFMLPLE